MAVAHHLDRHADFRGVCMVYLILLFIAFIAALGIYYFNYVYPILDDDESFAMPDDAQMKRTMADEYKGACAAVIAVCVIVAATFGAAKW